MYWYRTVTGVLRHHSINLTTLFFVAFLPVPTSLLFQGDGESPWPPALYALTIAGSFICLSWLWAHAHRAKLMHDWVDRSLYRMILHGTDPVVVVFVLSVPVAFVSARWAMYSWILIWPVAMIYGKWQQGRVFPEQRDVRNDEPKSAAQEP